MLFLPVLLFLSSCGKKVSWNTEIALPLARGELLVSDIVPDSVRQTQADGSVWLVVSDELFAIHLARDYFSVPDTVLRENVSLDSLRIPNRTMYYPITLGAIARSDQSGTGALIIALNGNTAAIPPFNNLNATDLPVDATELFKTADVRTGWMDLQIKNGLPVPITNLDFSMKNSGDGVVIVSDQVSRINPGESILLTYDLSGKKLEGQILVDINNISSPGSNNVPVPIDTSDALELTMTVRDMELNAAEAVFPAQNLVNVAKEVIYNMNGPEFTFMTIRSGKLVITAFNTINDSLYINYRIPNASDSMGVQLNELSVVPPGSSSSAAHIDMEIPLDGYSIDLTGKNHNRVNTFFNELNVRIDSTGKLIYISLLDSVSILYGLKDIVPRYVEGYLGQQHISYSSENQELNIFKYLEGGSLDLERVGLKFRIENEVGADSRILIHRIRTQSLNGASVELQAPFVGVPQDIERAFKNPFRMGETVFALDDQNSNVKEMIESLPRYLDMDIEVDINPDGNRLLYQDFASYGSTFKVYADLEMPLSGIAGNLQLSGKLDLNFPSEEELSNVESVQISSRIGNGFPLSAEVQAYIYRGGVLIDSLFGQRQQIAAAAIDEQSCRADNKEITELVSEIGVEQFDHLKTADELIFKSWLNTTDLPANCGSHVRIYDSYSIDVKMGLTINYRFANE